MRTKPAIPARVKRDIAAETGPRECEVIMLLRGCYGRVDYMEANYGLTPEYVNGVVERLSDLVEWIEEEHGISLQEGDIIDVMVEYADRMNDAWLDLMDI